MASAIRAFLTDRQQSPHLLLANLEQRPAPRRWCGIETLLGFRTLGSRVFGVGLARRLSKREGSRSGGLTLQGFMENSDTTASGGL